jgi:hypothetical protein
MQQRTGQSPGHAAERFSVSWPGLFQARKLHAKRFISMLPAILPILGS